MPDTPTPYDRILLATDHERELLLMRWREGLPCAPHDHAAAAGQIHLIEGSLTERRFAFDGRRLTLLTTHTYHAPAILHIAPGHIHDMCALSTPTTTLHHYTPPIQGMRIFDPARRETLTVPDTAGAWLPPSASADPILREPWLPDADA